MENKEFNTIYLVSPDGVAPSWMVGVSASVDLPLHHKVQKFLFGHWLTRVVPEKGPTTRRNAVYYDHIASATNLPYLYGSGLGFCASMACRTGVKILQASASSSMRTKLI